MITDKTILYAEDDAITRLLTTSHLKKICQNLIVSPDGKTALDRFQETKVDLLITDLEMPNMNGFELIRIIKRESPGTPVIITTAYRDEAKEFSDDIFIIYKPIMLKDLEAVIVRILS